MGTGCTALGKDREPKDKLPTFGDHINALCENKELLRLLLDILHRTIESDEPVFLNLEAFRVAFQDCESAWPILLFASFKIIDHPPAERQLAYIEPNKKPQWVFEAIKAKAKLANIEYQTEVTEPTEVKSLTLTDEPDDMLFETTEHKTKQTEVTEPTELKSHTNTEAKLHNITVEFHSKDFFEVDDRYTECTHSAQKCKRISRLFNVMQDYHNFLHTKDALFFVYLNAERVLNDFHHSMKHHTFDDVYDLCIKQYRVYTDSNECCSLERCGMLERNHRDRTMNAAALHRLYFGETAIATHDHDPIIPTITAKRQILDAIHCHYYHTIDIGYRLTKDERQTLSNINDEMKFENHNDEYIKDRFLINCNKILRNREQTISKIRGLYRLREPSTKFSTVIEEKSVVDYGHYGVGVRFFYWPYFKNCVQKVDPLISYKEHGEVVNPGTESFIHGKQHEMHDASVDTLLANASAGNSDQTLQELYVPPKFKDLHIEVIQNSICPISMDQWQILRDKSRLYLTTDHVRQMLHLPHDHELTEYYNMAPGAAIKHQHIFCVLLYCGYDHFQAKFSETCRKIPHTESIKSLISRHENFANFARLLRETVEIFADIGGSHTSDRTLYHGICEQMYFPSMKTSLHGPVSTTTEYAVAQSFCGNTGVIVEFNNVDSSWSKPVCFRFARDAKLWFYVGLECKFFSDFPNEEEIFFIGGYGTFSFKTIIDPFGNNYEFYIHALTIFNDMIAPGIYEESLSASTQKTKKQGIVTKMLLNIIDHQLHKYDPDIDRDESSSYMDKLIDFHFNNITYARIRPIDDTNKNVWRNTVMRIFHKRFCDENGFVKLELLTKMFPSLNGIHITSQRDNETFIEYTSIYTSILTFLETYLDTKLKSIEIDIPQSNHVEQKATEMAEKFQVSFLAVSWCITVIVTKHEQDRSKISMFKVSKIKKSENDVHIARSNASSQDS